MLTETLQIIIESGAKLSDRIYREDISCRSPLRYAIENDHDEAAEIIMKFQERDLIHEIYNAYGINKDINSHETNNVSDNMEEVNCFTLLHLLTDRGKNKLVEAFYNHCRPVTKEDLLQLQQFQQKPTLRSVGRRFEHGRASDERQLSCLHLAVIEDNNGLVVLFIKNGLDADLTYEKEYHECSPIALAVELDFLDIFRKLIFVSRVMAGEKRREILGQFLMTASEAGSKHIVEELLRLLERENVIEHEIFQNIISECCLRALRRGHEIISNILSKSIMEKNLNEALREAVKKGMSEIVQRLIVKGADVDDMESGVDEMSLILCVKYEQRDILPILLENSTVIPETFWYQLATTSDDFALHAFAAYKESRDIRLTPESLEFSDRKLNPLHIAAATEKVEVLNGFLDLGARHDLVDDMGNSIMHLAAANGCVGVIRNFCDYFPPNIKNKNGDTPLHLACKNGHTKIVNLLLQVKSIDLKVRNAIGDTCLHTAVRNILKNSQAINLTERPMLTNTAPNAFNFIIHNATNEDKVETVNIVASAFRSRSLLNEADVQGNTALNVLVQGGQEKEIPLLSGSTATTQNKEGKCALDYAMFMYATKPNLINELLATFGIPAAVYLATRYQESKMPLHVFAEHGQIDKVQLMVQHGASVTNFNADGNTIMHHIAELAASDTKNVNTYISMAQSIVKTLVNFRIRRQVRLYDSLRVHMNQLYTIVSEHYSEKALFAEHIYDEDLEMLIMIYLTRKIKNKDGLSVTNYAATIKSLVFLKYLLDVKKVVKSFGYVAEAKHSERSTYSAGEESGDDLLPLNNSYMDDEIKMATYSVNYLSPRSLHGLSIADCAWLNDAIQETLLIFLYPKIGRNLDDKCNSDNYDQLLIVMNEMKKWAIVERFESLRESEEQAKQSKVYKGWNGSNSAETTIAKTKNSKKSKSIITIPKRISVSHKTSKQIKQAPDVEISLLEIIIDMKDEITAAEIIDIMPLSKLVKNYWAAYRWIYFLIMLIHIAYMSLFSAFTISNDNCNFHTKNGTNPLANTIAPNINKGSFIHPYMLFLFYPFIFLIVTIYFEATQFKAQFHRRRVRRNKSPTSAGRIMDMMSNVMDVPFNSVRLILSYFPTICCFAYSVCMGLWYYEFTQCHDMEPYFHSACIIVGWLLTITYSKGFESLHSLTNVMESIMLTDILRFFMVYIFVCTGFSFGFHVLLQFAVLPGETPPDSALTALFENLRLFMNPSEIFKNGQFEQFEAGIPLLWVRIAYLFYSFFSGLILINILIAMMNDSYTRVSATERITWRVASLKQAMYLFSAVPYMSWLVGKILKNDGQIQSTVPAYRQSLTLYQLRCELPPPTEPIKTKLGELEIINKDVKYVESKLNELTIKVESMMDTRDDHILLINSAVAKIDELIGNMRINQNKSQE